VGSGLGREVAKVAPISCATTKGGILPANTGKRVGQGARDRHRRVGKRRPGGEPVRRGNLSPTEVATPGGVGSQGMKVVARIELAAALLASACDHTFVRGGEESKGDGPKLFALTEELVLRRAREIYVRGTADHGQTDRVRLLRSTGWCFGGEPG
jgi:hypothetical protein